MKEITIDGKKYQFSALSIRDYQDVYSEYKRTAPDPVKQLLETAKDLPESMREDFVKRHLDEAFDEKKRAGALNDPKFQEYLKGPEGAMKLLAKTIQKAHPNITDDQASDIFGQGVAEYGEGFLEQLLPGVAKGAPVRG